MAIANKTGNITPVIIILITGIILYANSLEVPFFFDDSPNIESTALQEPSLSFEELLRAATGASPYRPISNLSFTLNSLIHGNDVTGFHIVNILIHLCAALSLYFLLKQTLALPANRVIYGKHSSLALTATLLWLAHPLATQSVTYIVQRMTSMATLFYLLSLLLYVKGRLSQHSGQGKTKLPAMAVLYFLASLGSGLLAIGSKEIAVTLPIAVFLYEWYFFQDLNRNWLKNKIPWLAGAAAIILLFVFLYLGKNPIHRILHSCDNREFTTGERLLTQSRVVIHYLSLLLYPNPGRLLLDYNFPLSTSLLKPATTLASLLLLTLLSISALLMGRKERFLSFCILWFFLNLVIESSVICLEIIYEHRTYLPSAFLLPGMVAVLYRLTRNPKLATGLLLCVTLLFGYWTIVRNRTWQDELVFWSDNVRKAPGKPRSLTNLGNVFYKKNDFKQAIKYYTEAVTLLPEFALALDNRAIAYYRIGNFDEAEDSCSTALALEPNRLKTRYHLALIRYKKGRTNEAIEDLLFLHNKTPDAWQVNKILGQILLRSGQAQQALSYLETAAQFRPDDTEILMLEGETLMRLNKTDRAKDVFRKVLGLDQSSAGSHYNLAQLLSPKDELEEVLYHYRAASEYNPFYIPALYNFANLLLTLGKDLESELLYRRIIDMMPEMAGAYNNLGLIMIRQGKAAQAVQFFTTAARINPNDGQARKNLEQAEQELQSNQAEEFLPPK